MKFQNILVMYFFLCSSAFLSSAERVIIVQNCKNKIRSYHFESDKIFKDKLFQVATNIIESAIIDIRYESVVYNCSHEELWYFERKRVYLIWEVYHDLYNLFITNKACLTSLEKELTLLMLPSSRGDRNNTPTFHYASFASDYIVPHTYRHLKDMFKDELFIVETEEESSVYSYLLYPCGSY
jgi:hypothetical protein